MFVGGGKVQSANIRLFTDADQENQNDGFLRELQSLPTARLNEDSEWSDK